MNLQKKHSSTIPYLFTACIVFLGGYTELYSIRANGIFCAMQTGNLLNLFVHLIDENYGQALLSVIVFAVFAFGCFLAEVYRIHFPKRFKRYLKASVLLLQIFLLLPTLFISTNSGFLQDGIINYRNILSDSFLALYGAFHFITFREEDGHSYTPTMMTNMTKNIMVNLAACTKGEKRKEHAISALHYFLLVLCFVLGGITFYFLFRTLKQSGQLEYLCYLPAFVMVGNLLLIPFSVYVEKTEEEASKERNR